MHRIIAFSKPVGTPLVFLLFVLILPACNGSVSNLGSQSALPQMLRVAPPSGSGSATPIPFNFQTVDDPNSHVNRVMGLNQRAKIVGTFGVGSQSNIPKSYSASPPYTKFRSVNYPGSQGTVATSVSSTFTIGGYVIDPNGQSGISAFLQIQGLPTLLDDPNEGSGSDAVTEILGISDEGAAVGFYTNSKGVEVPFELNISQGTFTDLKPPGAKSAQATGINDKGNVTGIETTKSGIVGFYMHAGTYYPIARSNAQLTEPLGLNRQDQVVGYYQSSTGETHGFVLTYPTNGGDKQVWQAVDEPKAHDTTVVTGINDHDVISGWYKDDAGEIHGFVATPK